MQGQRDTAIQRRARARNCGGQCTCVSCGTFTLAFCFPRCVNILRWFWAPLFFFGWSLGIIFRWNCMFWLPGTDSGLFVASWWPCCWYPTRLMAILNTLGENLAIIKQSITNLGALPIPLLDSMTKPRFLPRIFCRVYAIHSDTAVIIRIISIRVFVDFSVNTPFVRMCNVLCNFKCFLDCWVKNALTKCAWHQRR